MFSKLLAFASNNVTYTTSALLLATAMYFILKTLVEYFLIFHKRWTMTKKLPGPIGLPLLGNALDILGKDTEKIWDQVMDWSARYPSPVCVWLAHELYFILHDPDTAKELLQSQNGIEKTKDYELLRKLGGNGLITSSANVWRVHRKLIDCVFNNRALPPYGAFFAKKAQELVKQMEVELNGKGFEISHYLAPCTINTIIGVILGTSVKYETHELRNFHEDISRFIEIAILRKPRVWLHPDMIFNRTALGKESNEIVDRLCAMIKKVLGKADAKKNDATVNGTKGGETLPGLFTNLPRDRDDFTRQDFFDELVTMIVAGSHTVITHMSAMTRMLAYHQDIQAKVYEELYSIYGSEDPAVRPVELEDFPRMEYLERVIHETMRILPPVGFVERAIVKDQDIGPCVLPAGSAVLINIMSLHRNEKYWPNPLKFDPDRFLPENVAKRHPGIYIPFSIGRRNCIGGKYAIMLLKYLAATMLRRYILRVDTIVPVENIRLKANIVLEPVEPWLLRIEERNLAKTPAKA